MGQPGAHPQWCGWTYDMTTNRLFFHAVGLAAFINLGLSGCSDGSRDGGRTDPGITGGSGGGNDAGGTGGDGSDGGDDGDGDSGGGDGDSGDSGGGDSDGNGGSDGGGDGDGSGGIRFDLGGDEDTGGGAGGGNGEGCEFLDILFVVDISGSMSEERANLAANFPGFVQVLDDYVADPDKGAVGYRLGVTNSTLTFDGSTTGLDGSLARGGFGGDCALGPSPWIDGPAPDVVDKFTCVADDPTAPCTLCADNGRERPLDAIELFVDKNVPGADNEGFYRSNGSLLVVVILTDEDDDALASTTTPAATKAKLDAFTGGAERYVVVSIAGPQMGGCSSAFGDAMSAPRLHEFTGAVDNGVMGDICLGDLSQPLADALDLIQISCDTLPPVG